jgi:hypothetical protein
MTTLRRVMKARSAKRLGCGCVPRIGEPIVRLDDGKWSCLPCLLAPLGATYPRQPGAS